MYHLTNLQVNCFATILEDTLIELRILANPAIQKVFRKICEVTHNQLPAKLSNVFKPGVRETLPKAKAPGSTLVDCDHKLRKEKTEHDRPILKRKKYNVKPSAKIHELDDIKLERLRSEEYKLKKFIDDRKLCDQILLDTYQDLLLKGSYRPLVEYNQSVCDRCDYQLFLTDDYARNKILRYDTLKQIRQQRNRIKSSYYKSDTVQDNLFIEYKDAILKRETEERYVDAWERSRHHQHEFTMQQKEERQSETIMHFRSKQDDERKVNYNIEKFNETNRKEIIERMEAAMNKYDHDIQEIEIKLHRMHSNYDDQVLKRREIEKRLADQGEKLTNWLQFKKEREIIRRYNAKMSQAAIVVQAWWRGILVRLKLGPFKKGFLKKVSKKGNKKMLR